MSQRAGIGCDTGTNEHRSDRSGVDIRIFVHHYEMVVMRVAEKLTPNCIFVSSRNKLNSSLNYTHSSDLCVILYSLILDEKT